MKDLLQALEQYAGSGYYPFHMPGHKRRLGEGGPALCGAAALDVTEIEGFDNLHAPEGILKEAMMRAAALYGADEAFYSVNGSTAGLLTALSAALPEGGKVILARNCHKAVYHGLYLRRLHPVYLYPAVVPELMLADVVTPEMVEEALDAHPDAGAVVLPSPTYDGLCADVETIAGAVHRRGAVLIVDAAHGAHFGFHPDFPQSPLKQGADLVVVSLHKTLPSMTQTALLLRSGDRVPPERLRLFSGIYQTSSPSYFLMAGMDACIRRIAREGAGLWERFFRERSAFLEQAGGLRRLRVWTAGRMPEMKAVAMDPGKILIHSAKTGLTGQQLYDILLSRYHLQLEMAAGDYVTAIATCCDTREGWERLGRALRSADRMYAGLPAQAGGQEPYPLPEPGISLWDAMDAPGQACPLEEAAGKIAGAFINLYPPGIPIVVPGERLTEETVGLLRGYEKQRLPLQGVSGGLITVAKGCGSLISQ